MPTFTSEITGAILAGGRSRRMGGGHKALLELAGKPLLSHVISCLQPQCHRLVLSVEKADDCWSGFGLEQVCDPQPGSHGPLGGVLAALEVVGREPDGWLLLAPCDAPFLPSNLAEELHDAAQRSGTSAALVSYEQHWQPTFSLWHCRLLPGLRKAVQQGQSGLQEFLREIQRTGPVAVVEWDVSTPSPFFNINDAEDLAAAANLLDPGKSPIS